MGIRNSGAALRDYEAHRVCLIKPSALGDLVQSLPVLGALRRRFPKAHLSWVVNDSYAELLEGHPDLDEVIRFERRARGWAWWRGLARLASRLRGSQFDLVCDLQGLLRSGLMARVTGAARRVGLSTSREGAGFFYTDVVNVPTLEMPAVDRYWLIAEELGVGDVTKCFTLGLSQFDRGWAQRRLAELPRPVLALHAGARWMTKRWPPEQFAELGRRAQREYGAGIVLVGGAEESWTAKTIADAIDGPVLSLAGETSLKQLAAVLRQADVVLSGDSGPMHLAAAMGTPVVALFTCTSPLRAGPYGQGHTVVATDVDCAASYLKTCDRLDCMKDVSVARVWTAVGRALERRGSHSGPHFVPCRVKDEQRAD